MLRVPKHIRGCLFDLNGVLTDTAAMHAAAWKDMFDQFLRDRAERAGAPFVPFDPVADYHRYVGGRARLDGAREFLLARGIELPDGPDDGAPSRCTTRGLCTWKNQIMQRKISAEGVRSFPGSVRFVRAASAAGLACAVASSSTNCQTVLRAAGLSNLFDVVIDGVEAARQHLQGKPAPDTLLAAAAALGLAPAESAVFEDAPAGVAAGRAGGLGWVVGVDRVGLVSPLRSGGADVVVADLAELLS